jgi:hypothetical protein
MSRFGSWKELAGWFDKGPVRQTFTTTLADQELKERMDRVRSSIETVRADWLTAYPERFEAVRRVLEEEGAATGEQTKFGQELAARFRQPRDWLDRAGTTAPVSDFSAVQLYTTEVGYNAVFSVVNRVFRAAHHDKAIADAGAFVVELLNIDLFNYWCGTLNRSDFVGEVYRGMCVSEDAIAKYKAILNGPVEARSMGIPLSMVSTSLNAEVPRSFMRAELKGKDSLVPLLWKIYVIGLGSELLAVYQKHYESVVSSICALPICKLSEFPGEEEVLLRGPFFQLLRVTEASEQVEPVAGKPVTVIEAVMVTANRDHHSTLKLGTKDKRARQLFGALVSQRKYEFCESFHAKQAADAALYRAARESASAHITLLEQAAGT